MTSPNILPSSELPEELENRLRQIISEDNDEDLIEELKGEEPTAKQWNFFFDLFDDLSPTYRHLMRTEKIDKTHALVLRETGVDLHYCQLKELSRVLNWMKVQLEYQRERERNQHGR